MVNRNRVTGLKFSNGTIKQADIYIANADLPYVYNELLPDKMQARKINNKQYSCSALVLHWGLKKTYPQLDHHNVFLSRDMEEGMNKIFKFHSIHENPSFYIHCPVRSDPSAAPEGGDTLSVIIPCGHITNRSDQQWDELIKPVKESVLRSLKKAGLEDIEENIKFEIFYSPPSWKNYFNVSKGSVFGSLKHNITQMGFFRPHNRHNRYRNLYFTGGSTHPGNGVPLVLLSGKLTAERIISENLPSQI
jgi:phytoene desaturase